MSASTTITHDGQVKVPSEVLESLGVRPGDQVEFIVIDGRTVFRPSGDVDNPFAQFAGCLPGFTSMEEIVAWEREMRDPEGECL